MKRKKQGLWAVAFAGVLAVDIMIQAPVMVVSAHGSRHGGNHCGHNSGSNVEYYYCNGHEAHQHENGNCPYTGTEYYYCDGHEAHQHENGNCPYVEVEYHYCNGHEAHLHENGNCPYAEAEYHYCNGHEAHLHENGVCPYAVSLKSVYSKNVLQCGVKVRVFAQLKKCRGRQAGIMSAML